MKYIAGFEYTDDEWDTMDKTARRKVSEVILDLLLSPTYLPKYKQCSYPLCPQCKITMVREYQRFCDRCVQQLDWSKFEDAKEVYIGWDGVNKAYLP